MGVCHPVSKTALTGRPRSTLYRHLKRLWEMQWIRVDQVGRRIVIRPIITHCARAAAREAARTKGQAGGPVTNEALL